MNTFLLILLGLGFIGLAGLFAWWAVWPHKQLPANRMRNQRLRLWLRLPQGKGHATVFELWLRWSRCASWRESKRTRPTLNRWARLRFPDLHSVFLGRAQFLLGLRLPVQEHGVILSPPREGKTALLAHAIIKWPGPCIVTTVKDDLFTLTSGIRQHGRRVGILRRKLAGGPVYMFNPESYGGWPSSFSWNLIRGCQDESTAMRRAESMTNAVSVKGTDDGSFWSGKAAQMFTALFCAADLLNGDLRMVARWVFSDDTEAREVLQREGKHQLAATLVELHNASAEKTASVFRMVMTSALQFMGDPKLARCVLPVDEGFDVERFLAEKGTLYLMASGDQENSPIAPLFACLITELRFIAAARAMKSPGKRLCPPLALFGDELSQVAPIAIHKWLAAVGGLGMMIWAVFHGESQMQERWGDKNARTIMDTAGCKVVLPGVSDPNTLDMLSKLCGRDHWKIRGQEGYNGFDVMEPAMIRELSAFRALVIRRGRSIVLIKTARVWKSWAFRSAKWRGGLIADIEAAKAYDGIGQVHAKTSFERQVEEMTAVAQAMEHPDLDSLAAFIPPQADGDQPPANGNGHNGHHTEDGQDFPWRRGDK